MQTPSPIIYTILLLLSNTSMVRTSLVSLFFWPVDIGLHWHWLHTWLQGSSSLWHHQVVRTELKNWVVWLHCIQHISKIHHWQSKCITKLAGSKQRSKVLCINTYKATSSYTWDYNHCQLIWTWGISINHLKNNNKVKQRGQ